MRIRILISPLGWIIMAVVMIVVAEIAWGQNIQCGSRADVFQQLRISYGEHPRWIGVNHNGTLLMELHTDAKNGSWSLTATDTDKRTCLVGGGDGWTWGPYGEPT